MNETESYNVKSNRQRYLNALNIGYLSVNSGFIKFDDFSKKMVTEIGQWIKPILKSLYIEIYYDPSMEETAKKMDAIEYIDSFDIDSLFIDDNFNNMSFKLNSIDYRAINITQNIIRRLLVRPCLTPKQIVGIGNFLFAFDRLPLKTKGANTSIKLEHKNCDGLLFEARYFNFSIQEYKFHIDINGYVYDRTVGGDSINYPSWHIESEGFRVCECDLDLLEDQIYGYLNLGVSLSVEDKSKIEYENMGVE